MQKGNWELVTIIKRLIFLCKKRALQQPTFYDQQSKHFLFTIAFTRRKALKGLSDFLGSADITYLVCWTLPSVTHPFPMAGFCRFFQLSSLALILESLTGPVWEMGMQEMKKDLSSPASLVTEDLRGLSSRRPAVHKPENREGEIVVCCQISEMYI